MSPTAVLTPHDDLFGRVALFNNLVTLEHVVECARVIGAEMVAGRPRRSLATMLILRGHLTPQAAGAVEAALRKRLAAGAAPAAPTPKPPPLADRLPAGTSQISLAIGGDEQPGAAVPAADERLRKVIARISPSRIYPEMLSYIVSRRVSVIDAKQLAAAIGEPEKAVVAALHCWQRAGLLHKIGTHPYNFSPGEQDQKDLEFFLEAWNDPERHAKVLGCILAVEE